MKPHALPGLNRPAPRILLRVHNPLHARPAIGSAVLCVHLLMASEAHGSLATTGRWQSSANLGATGTHVAVLRDSVTDSTKVFFMGGSGTALKLRTWKFSPSTAIAIPDINSASLKHIPLPREGVDLFCSGHATLPDGKLLIIGGEYQGSTGTELAFRFSPSISDSTQVWGVTEQATMVQERWYPTVTALPDGRQLASTGARFRHMIVFGGQLTSGSLNDSLYPMGVAGASYWTNNSTSTGPSARVDHAVAFDGIYKRLTVVGGDANGSTSGGKRIDVWGVNRASDDSTWLWRADSILADGVHGLPAARSRHSLAYNEANGSFYMFGGLDSLDTVLGDVWRGTRSLVNTWTWTKLSPSGTPPSARFGHAAIIDTKAGAARMIVFGGKVNSTDFADSVVWSLSLGGSPAWSTLVSSGGPSPREGHSLTLDSRPTTVDSTTSRRFVVFGGRAASGLKGDMWGLWRDDTGSPTYSWTQDNATGGPSARTRHSMVSADNRMVVFGGDTTGTGTAVATCWVYSSLTQSWSVLPQKDQSWTNNARPLLGHGAVIHSEETTARIPEIFDPQTAAGSWTPVKNGSGVHAGQDPVASYEFMFPLPSGKLFFAGPVFDPNLRYRYLLDLTAGQWDTTSQFSSYAAGSAVMYAPGKILRSGRRSNGDRESDGATTSDRQIFLDGGSSLGWQALTAMIYSRANHNLTVLPNGRVIATGGIADHEVGAPSGAKVPEIWNPADSTWRNNLGPGSATFAPDPVVRNYHSAAILLPDGRVWSSGGENPVVGKDSVTIFEPPYLFTEDSYATRPTVACIPRGMTYGQRMTIRTEDAVNIRKVSLIRPGAVTHGHNQDQYFVPLVFDTVTTSPKRVLVTLPANGNYAPPGDYLVFLLNSNDTPSIGRWIRLNSIARDDSCDTVAPGTPVVFNACQNITENTATLTWSAPADDGALSLSGKATLYDIRRSSSSIDDDTDFAGASAISPSPPAPGNPGASQTVTVTSVPSTVKIYFRMKTKDDNGNWSALSDQIELNPPWESCGGEGLMAGGGGGGEGSRQQRVRGAASLTQTAGQMFSENSVFDDRPLETTALDLLELPGLEATAAGQYSVRIRTGAGHAAAIDRVRLLAVDHPDSLQSFIVGGEPVLGTRHGASEARDNLGTDVVALVNGEGAEAYWGDSASTVVVFLPGTGPLLIESQGQGEPEASFELQQPVGDGTWATVRDVIPRRHFAATTTEWPEDSVRVRFLGRAGIQFIGRIEGASANATTSFAELVSASDPESEDLLEALSGQDSLEWVSSGADTLLVRFQSEVLDEGMVRDVYLATDGMRLLPETAAARASRLAGIGPPRQIALRQNAPNPFRERTSIRFELPTGAVVRLDVFDVQGRRLRTLAHRFYPAGYHAIEWDRRTTQGNSVGPGVYFYRMQTLGYQDKKRMVLLP